MGNTGKWLTAKDEEVMFFWGSNGVLFVKQIVEMHGDSRHHFSTISIIVRVLEEKSYLTHKIYGNTYEYSAVVSEKEYKRGKLKSAVDKYSRNSLMGAVSAFVEEDISVDELKEKNLYERSRKRNMSNLYNLNFHGNHNFAISD